MLLLLLLLLGTRKLDFRRLVDCPDMSKILGNT